MENSDILIKTFEQLSEIEIQQAILYLSFLKDNKNKELEQCQKELSELKQSIPEEKTPDKKLDNNRNVELRDWYYIEESIKKKKKTELENLNIRYSEQLLRSEKEKQVKKIKSYTERLMKIVVLLKSIKNALFNDEIAYKELLDEIKKEALEDIKLDCNDIRLMIYIDDNNRKIRKYLKDYEDKPNLLESEILTKLKVTLASYRKKSSEIKEGNLLNPLDYKVLTLSTLLNEDAKSLYDFLVWGQTQEKKINRH